MEISFGKNSSEKEAGLQGPTNIMQKPDTGLFGKKQQLPFDAQEIINRVNDSITRLRMLEERNLNLREKITLTEENMLKSHKKIFSEIKSVNLDISVLKKEINEIKEKLKLIIAEMKNFPSKQDFKVLQRYVELWQPMNFITKQEVDRIVEDSVKEAIKK